MPLFVFRFLRSQSAKNEKQLKIKYRSAEGKISIAAIDRSPRAAAGFAGRGQAYAALEQWQSAGADLDHAVALAPRDRAVLLSRSDVREQSGDFVGALGDLNRAIELDRQKAELYGRRGSYYERRGDVARAQDDYQQAVKLDPNIVPIQLRLSALLAMHKSQRWLISSGYCSWMPTMPRRVCCAPASTTTSNFTTRRSTI